MGDIVRWVIALGYCKRKSLITCIRSIKCFVKNVKPEVKQLITSDFKSAFVEPASN